MTCVPRWPSSCFASGPGRDPGGGLAGAGPLEHVAGVVEAVLLHPDEVGVAGARLAQRLLRWRPGAGDISSSHFGHSVLRMTTDTGDPSVRPWRTPPSELDLVLLEAHARAPPEPEAAAGELDGDVVDQ